MLVCKNLLLTFTSGPHSEMGGDAGNGEKDRMGSLTSAAGTLHF